MQTFLLDHEVIRHKLRQLRERCCPASKFKYIHVEDDIVSTPGWPPVGDDPITAVYQEENSFIQASESDRMLPSTSDSNNCCSTAPASSRTSMTQSDGLLNSQSSIYPTDTSCKQSEEADVQEPSPIEEPVGEHSGNGIDTSVLIEPKGEHSGNGTDSVA